MTNPPSDPFAFRLRFVCGFLFFGVITLLIGLRLLDSAGIIPTLVLCLLTTLLLSFYIARGGDERWGKLLNFFRWW